ncbi:ATP-binding protein [Nocardia sp. CA-135953]|uniref:ATP-binding protein n=1 Tax=Nocardia sp. CA-135953 TaxID=3239978 RepID=UPI003D976291
MFDRRQGVLRGLPIASVGFVGREQELDRISPLLLGRPRLVTLIGSGGIGKTRLAEEAVRRLHRARHTPIYWTQLAGLATDADITAIKETIAETVLGPISVAGTSAWDGVMDFLACPDVAQNARSVLVLDNCEHVLRAASEVVVELLDRVAGLTIVTTSREPIGWVDEHLVVIGPMSVDESLEVFRRRVELTGRHLTDAAQIDMARAICRHLHGHPLHVRLAAARMFYEPLPMILRQLTGDVEDRRMQWEYGLRVGVESRHRSIGDDITWSYNLCQDDERLLFDRLSIFAPSRDCHPEEPDTLVAGGAGADLAAIEAICSDDTALGADQGGAACPAAAHQPSTLLPRSEIRVLLERLVRKSLVSAHNSTTSVRYSLAESLRVYAQQRLVERSTGTTDELARLARRHRCYYHDTLLEARIRARKEPKYLDEVRIHEWTRKEWSNIRLAIESSFNDPGRSEIGLHISMTLISLQVSFAVSPLPTTRRWLETALHTARMNLQWPTQSHLMALSALGFVRLCEGAADRGTQALEECLVASTSDPDVVQRLRNNPETDVGLPAEIEFAWGTELLFREHSVDALMVLDRAAGKFFDNGDLFGELCVRTFEAFAAGFIAPPDEALKICRGYLQSVVELDAIGTAAWGNMALSIALARAGRAREALLAADNAIAAMAQARNQWGKLWASGFRMFALAHLITEGLAGAGIDDRRLTSFASEIAQRAGGMAALGKRLGVDIDGLAPLREHIGTAVKAARSVLSDSAFEAAYRQEALLRPTRDETMRPAAGTLPTGEMLLGLPDRSDTSPVWHALSQTEREVAVLAAAGWPNSAIAARRGRSTKTINAQMYSIFQKLTIRSRDNIIRFVPDRQREEVAREHAQRPR